MLTNDMIVDPTHTGSLLISSVWTLLTCTLALLCSPARSGDGGRAVLHSGATHSRRHPLRTEVHGLPESDQGRRQVDWIRRVHARTSSNLASSSVTYSIHPRAGIREMFIFCVKCVCPHDFYCTLGHSEYTHYLNRTTKPCEYNILVHVCMYTSSLPGH